MSDNQFYPPICIPDPTAIYCFQVNGYRLVVECARDAFYDRCYDFQFDETQQGLIDNPEVTGEIKPLRDSFYVIGPEYRERYSSWIVTINFQVWPKSELGLSAESWKSEQVLISNTLNLYRRLAHKTDEWPNYTKPLVSDEITLIDSVWGNWSLSEFGDFSTKKLLLTELTSNLVLTVDFNFASFWDRGTYPPEGLKDHLMPFFTDYLSRIQIIPTEGVPESELPPLGFYPSKREEKEVDSEGNTVVEDTSSTSSSEWGW